LKPNGEPHPHPSIFSFKSVGPTIPLADGTGNFQCELESADFGKGLAQGFFWFTVDVPFPGLFQANQRNVMTFSDAPWNGL